MSAVTVQLLREAYESCVTIPERTAYILRRLDELKQGIDRKPSLRRQYPAPGEFTHVSEAAADAAMRRLLGEDR